jgi:uncharacterized protein (DUF2141 family)
MVAEKHDNVGMCDFTGVPEGTHASTILDNTNLNGKMDLNMIGMPKGLDSRIMPKRRFRPPRSASTA